MSKDYKKLYKEALERAKIFKSPYCQHATEVIFPELRESEDERIRKELLDYLKRFIPHYDTDLVTKSKCWIAWLEKQGEQKLIEQDTEVNDLWVYIREWNDKFGRLPKDEDELAACIDYVMKRQKPAEWSEEDEANMDAVWKACGQIYGTKYQIILGDWLKSLKGRVQPKQEWNEKDKANLDNIIWFCENCEKGIENTWIPSQAREIKELIKSLKTNHWKPNEEQLTALKNVIIGKRGLLYNLYFELEKL